jgi:carbamoyl-phosphate synthase large subunit
MKKTYNILVTGVGAIIGYGIIESLKTAHVNCKIIGVDVFEENYGKYICDEFIQVPYTNNPEYKNIIQKLIADFKIDIVFPGIEQDLYYFIDNHSFFDTKIVLNKKELVHLSKDKWEMYKFLKDKSCDFLIPTYIGLNYKTAIEKIGHPFIIKPKSSYAAKGFHVIKNEKGFIKIADEVNESTLFQPCIGTDDEEYTISVFGDGNGNFIDKSMLRRYLSKAGASEKVFTVKEDKQLENAVKELVKIFEPEGPTNFQFRKQQDKVYLLEINPRISSACSLRTKFGYNDPLFCIQHYLENKIYSVQDKKDGKAIRYIADKIIYE